MKILYKLVYQFSSVKTIERHETREMAEKVHKWAKNSGYKVWDIEEVEYIGQHPLEIHHMDIGKIKYFDEIGKHLLNEY